MKLDLGIRKAASISAALQGTAPTVRMVPLDDIYCDPRLQVRVALSEDHLSEDLIPKILDGERLAPVTLGDLEGRLFLTSGFHRVEAHRRAGKDRIEAEILPVQAWRDLVAMALPTNDDHGLPLTRADRRRKVEMACVEYFDEIAAGRMSDNALAALCHVSVSLVNDVRRGVGGDTTTERTVTRNGATYTMDTAKIGRPKLASADTLSDLLEEYLDSLQDEWETITMLVAAQQEATIAAALAEKAELPAHKPATLTSAISDVLLRRTVAVYLPRQAAQMLVLLLDNLSASYTSEKDSLLSLIKPQIACGLGDTTWEIAS